MADELNTPNHRYYQNRYNVKLAPNEMSKQWILASGIARIDNAAVLPLFASAEPGTWYDPSDLTTLFQDSAGTTPVTAPGQTVGLMLDKSQGLVLGSELVTNGDFASATGWTLGTGWSIGSGVATHVAPTNGYLQQNLSWTAGRQYKVTMTVNSTNGFVQFPSAFYATQVTFSSAGTYTFYLTPLSGTLWIFASGDTVIDNISVKLLAGNHATQATSTQRPTYGINPIVGTRNLLTYTEQFDNAVWTKLRATVTANSTTSPDGTSNADTLLDTAVTGTHVSIQTITKAASVLTYTATVYLKKSTLDQGELRMSDQSGNGVRCTFNLTTVAVGTPVAFGTGFVTGSSQITDAGNGWYRVTLTGTTNAAVTLGIEIYIADASGNISYTGTGAGFFVWGAQLEASATATAYQKVVSQYEVTQAGVQSAGYLAFDGVDDGMVTNTITPAINKVQVFAGVRKLSDAAQGMLVELSASLGSNNGSFALSAPVSAFNSYRMQSKGTLAVLAETGAEYPSPITNIITGIGDIASPVATLRVNGVQSATVMTTQGTGNYLAYPLYLGRRGGTLTPFNGRIYSLIVRFGPNLTDSQIASTESWVNAKTGAY